MEYVFAGLLVLAVATLLYREFSPPGGEVEVAGVLPNSIAVLPFENLSPDPDQEYIAAGFHESTLNQLAKIRDLIVIARTSVLQYEDNPPPIPEIAAALNVEMVMEGSVRYANDRVLITAQLIDGRTGGHLWSAEYNRDLSDIFGIQAEIAENIAMALEAELLPSELARIEKRPTDSTEAYEHYLRALSLPHVGVFTNLFDTYIESLDRAIALDPAFAEAYAEKARGYSDMGDHSGALEYAGRAIELDPTIGMAYSARALVYRSYYDRQDEARAAHERAVELTPNDAEILIEYARFLAYNDEYEEAIRLGNRVISMDPRDFSNHDRLGIIFAAAGDYPAAARQFREALNVDPTAGSTYILLSMAQLLSGNTDEAEDNLKRAMQIWQPTPNWGYAYGAYLYGRLGQPAEAERLLREFDKFTIDSTNPDRAWLPFATLGTRDTDRALAQLTDFIGSYVDEGQPARPSAIQMFRTNRLRDPILDQPEFVEVRSRLGFRE